MNRKQNWPDLLNARDMGGYRTRSGNRTRWRALIRTDGLHKLTPEGADAAIDYGVRTVIDLRFANEVQRMPNAFAADPRVRYLHLPLYEVEDLVDQVAVRQGPEAAVWNISLMQQAQPSFARIFRSIIEAPPGGVLFHCHVGKDRTGLIALLLGDLADLPEETLISDYLESNDNLEPLFADILARYAEKPAEQAAVRKKLYGPAEMVPVTREFIRETFGTTRGYLRQIGLENREIDMLRTRIVEEP